MTERRVSNKRLEEIIYDLTESPSKPFWLELVLALSELRAYRSENPLVSECALLIAELDHYNSAPYEHELPSELMALLCRVQPKLNKAIAIIDGTYGRKPGEKLGAP